MTNLVDLRVVRQFLPIERQRPGLRHIVLVKSRNLRLHLSNRPLILHLDLEPVTVAELDGEGLAEVVLFHRFHSNSLVKQTEAKDIAQRHRSMSHATITLPRRPRSCNYALNVMCTL